MTEPEPAKTETPAAPPPAPEETPAPVSSEPAAVVASEPAVPAPAPEATVTEPPVVTEPVITEDAATAAEDASDAQLRAWAKDNGIDDVPGSGRLSAAWREDITKLMAEALDPKEEGSAEDTSSESSTPSEKTIEPVVEYRTPWVAPDTWVSGQTFTA